MLSPSAKTCPHCGCSHPLVHADEASVRRSAPIIIAILGGLLALISIALVSQRPQPPSELETNFKQLNQQTEESLQRLRESTRKAQE